jgi:SAM-dependent methyltransferase
VRPGAGEAILFEDGRSYPVVDGVPVLLAGGAADEPAFRADRLARVEEIEQEHFWFQGRRVLVEALLDRRLPGPGRLVLDLGCGSGSLLDVLERRGQRVIGIDVRPEGLARARKRHPDALLLRAEADRLPLRDGVLDAVVALDVLEHVDDAAALAEVARVLRPGGLLLASVPAVPWLWSFRDEDAGHLRRYTRDSLVGALGAAGLEVAELRRYQFVLFPLVAAARLAGRRGPRLRDAEDLPRPAVNRALAAVSRLDARIGARITWPWGSSLVACARRPA